MIVSLVARGGMARVYEGHDQKLGRTAAVKVMELRPDHTDEFTQRFIREARAVASLDHPNIVTVYQFGEEPGLYYMAMKYIDGLTLASLLKELRALDQHIEPDRIVAVITDIGAALDYAHSRGVIHRDIKPSNIMLTRDGHAVLTDFGLTMQVGDDTTLGTAFGTPRYIAPEQALSSSQAGPQSDIYSLGVALYEMVTGQAPFDDDSPMGLALSHITTPPPPPITIRPNIPHPVETVILKALEKRKENRWLTATAMADALRAAYQGVEPNVKITNEPLDVTPGSLGAPGEPETQSETQPVTDSQKESQKVTPAKGIGDPSTFPLPITPTGVMPAAQIAAIVAQARPKPRRPVSAALWGVLLVALMILVIGLGIVAIVPRPPAALPTISAAVDAAAGDTTPRVRLIYSADTFAVYNPGTQTVSLEGVSFVRNDSASRPFDAAQFGDRVHRALPGGQCLQMRLNTADPAKFPFVCGPQIQPRVYEDPAIIFWAERGDQDPVTTFLATRNGQTLQTCSMRLNTCEFGLP